MHEMSSVLRDASGTVRLFISIKSTIPVNPSLQKVEHAKLYGMH